MITLTEIKEILADNDPDRLEELAQASRQITRQYFGRTISLYAPLYISNYCSSYCTYCGFHSHHRIKRFKLIPEEMHQEMRYIAGQGIENILILTGESYQITPLSYLKEAVAIAKNYFPSISLEVHPMTQEEYAQLFAEGVDGITVYQETYNPQRYRQVHISGIKADFDFRLQTPQRAAQAGLRSISLGILLGLSEVADDLFALYNHLHWMEKNFPGVEYSLSFPRLKTIKGQEFFHSHVEDKVLVKIICLTRINFPRIGINLSTRENPQLRDRILELGITRMSAGSNTAVGGYTLKPPHAQDPQFDVEDRRSVADIVALLKTHNFDPVFTDWRRIPL